MQIPNTLIQTSINALEFFRMDAPLQRLFALKKSCYALFEDAENKMHYGVVECIHSYQSALLVLNRFVQEEHMHHAEQDALLSKESSSEAKQLHSVRMQVLGKLVSIDIESFYTVSKQLLDRTADLFKLVFGIVVFDPNRNRELGSTFVQFERHFAFWVRERSLTAVLNFQPKLKELVEYRNGWLEHLEDFGRGRGMMPGGTKGTRICWHGGGVETEPPKQLLVHTQEYLVDFVQFLEENLDKSPLPRKSA